MHLESAHQGLVDRTDLAGAAGAVLGAVRTVADLEERLSDGPRLRVDLISHLVVLAGRTVPAEAAAGHTVPAEAAVDRTVLAEAVAGRTVLAIGREERLETNRD